MDDGAKLETIISQRRSIRAFRPDPVDGALVERILDVAARAPSGTNMQPWKAYALTGPALGKLKAALLSAEAEDGTTREAEYQYYPSPIFEPYMGRRRKVGLDLYGILGIARGETAKMRKQHARNLMFFDAPVGLMFTINRKLKIGSWLDYGMFLQNVMVAARCNGLETCVQAAFAPFHEVIRADLGLDPDEIVVCGMSLGYADPNAPENALDTERVEARSFTRFIGFDDEPVTVGEPASVA